MRELLAGYAKRNELVVVVAGSREVVVRVLSVGQDSVTLAPIDGSRPYHAHPNAVMLHEMEPAQ